jgi:hypothetical protein
MSPRYLRIGRPRRRQLSTTEKMAAILGPASLLPKCSQLRRLSKYFDKRRNWIHIGSEKAGPKVAAIFSIVESCRRLGIPIRQYLLEVLPGLLNRSIKSVAQLTPAAYAAKRAK